MIFNNIRVQNHCKKAYFRNKKHMLMIQTLKNFLKAICIQYKYFVIPKNETIIHHHFEESPALVYNKYSVVTCKIKKKK